MIKNKTISWKEQPQATLEAIIVPILNQIEQIDSTCITIEQIEIRESVTRILVKNEEHTQVLADYIWSAMANYEKYPNLEK